MTSYSSIVIVRKSEKWHSRISMQSTVKTGCGQLLNMSISFVEP